MKVQKPKNEWWWDGDQFEDYMTRALIALFDDNIEPYFHDGMPFHMVSRQDIHRLMSAAPYFGPQDRDTATFVDMENDGLPRVASIAWGRGRGNEPNLVQSNSWFEIMGGVVTSKYPAYVRPTCPGTPVKFIVLCWKNDGRVVSTAHYGTIDRNGDPKLAQSYAQDPNNPTFWNWHDIWGDEEKETSPAQAYAICAGIWTDRRFLWNVQAQEQEKKVQFGVYESQIQSLLYSRTLPITDSGRKRPILHWVRAHNRRLKSGTEVQIEKHLRGVDEFVLHNTKFKITRPQKRTKSRG